MKTGEDAAVPDDVMAQARSQQFLLLHQVPLEVALTVLQ
jgi:hypothetical protein